MEYDAAALRGREGLDRRIAPRQPVERLVVDLAYEQVRSFGRRKVHHVAMQVVDLSVDGALLLGPRRKELEGGALVTLSNPARAVAEIRHVKPSGDDALYGVRFVSMEERFREGLFAHLGRDREGMQEAWLHAR
jgi:hypothetical protein